MDRAVVSQDEKRKFWINTRLGASQVLIGDCHYPICGPSQSRIYRLETTFVSTERKNMSAIDSITRAPLRPSTILILVTLLVALGFSTPCATGAPSCPADPQALPPHSCVIYNSWNGDGVSNNPSIHPTFTTSVGWYVLQVVDYHWNFGQGQDPAAFNGWIGIYDNTSGTFAFKEPAIGWAGAFEVPNSFGGFSRTHGCRRAPTKSSIPTLLPGRTLQRTPFMWVQTGNHIKASPLS